MTDLISRPRGEWVTNPSDIAGEGFNICSACGEDVYDSTNFCPNCCSDMRGENDDKG